RVHLLEDRFLRARCDDRLGNPLHPHERPAAVAPVAARDRLERVDPVGTCVLAETEGHHPGCAHDGSIPSISVAARAVPGSDWRAEAIERRRVCRCLSPSRRSTAASSSSSSKAYVASLAPNPVSSTRCALSYWSQNSGSAIIGLP